VIKDAVIDCVDGLSRDLYASPDAVDAMRRDPSLEDVRWVCCSPRALGLAQDWTFGGFDPLTAEPLKLQLPGDCLICHQAAVTNDMSFSLSLLRRS
jgi:hypothetical protein